MLSFLLSIAITIVVLPSVALWWRAQRGGLYRKVKKRSLSAQTPPHRGLSVPELPLDAVLDTQIDGMKAFLQVRHQEAVALQERYHDALVAALAAIGLGFLALAISLTFGSQTPLVQKTAALLDVLCFAIAIAGFFLAIRTGREWVNIRTRTELLRQWIVIEGMLLEPREGDILKRLHKYEAQINRELSVVSESNIDGVVQGIWERLAEKWMDDLSGLQTLTPGISAYFHRRVLRQQQWFLNARDRTLSHASSFSKTLLGLFIVVFSAAVLKFAVVFHLIDLPSFWKDIIVFTILGGIACSAFFSALFFNQNARSLSHRYETQRRWIIRWQGSFVEMLCQSPLEKMLAKEILAFEQLMIDELLDWITITAHDRAEVAV